MDSLSKILNQFNKLKVLIIGDAILDAFIKGRSSRICREAPVPVVDFQEITHTPGGAANTAANIATLGANSYFLTVVGDDQAGQVLLEKLNSFKVNTENIIKDDYRATLVKQRINADFQMIARLDSGSIDYLTSNIEKLLIDKLKQIWEHSQAVIISDYHKGLFTPKVILELANLQKMDPKILVVDSSFPTKFAKLNPTAVKPNYLEAITALNIKEIKKGVDRIGQIWQKRKQLLRKTGADIVAATFDVNGACFFDKGENLIKTYSSAQDHKNASGAGDTFTASLALSLSAGASLKQTARICYQATQQVLNQPGTTVVFLNQLKSDLKINIDQIKQYLNQERKLGKRIVFTNGCFDLLHVGHISYLKEARGLGNILIIGINTDESVKKLKGKDRPINTLEDRMAILKALDGVDLVIPFSQDTPINLIRKLKPDIYVKGGDYSEDSLPEASVVKGYGGQVKIIPLTVNHSTTKIIKNIKAQATL